MQVIFGFAAGYHRAGLNFEGDLIYYTFLPERKNTQMAAPMKNLPIGQILVEDGFIRLNTPVGEILPQFAEKPFDKITLWHLLTHTSGLYPDGGCFPEAAPKDAWELIDLAAEKWDGKSDFDWISTGISAGLRRPTGTEWQYCSFGFALLGEIIARVSGKHAHDYIEEKILRPLKMTDSSFYFNADTALFTR